MMKQIISLILVALPIISALAEVAAKRPYEDYTSIIDRQMFGALPPGFDPTKLPTEVAKIDQKALSKEQEKLQSAIRFSMINITPSGEVAVGFSDNSNPKAPVHYYLKVGEERGGWTLLEADPYEETMKIVKNDIEVSLKLGGDSSGNQDSMAKVGGDDSRAANSGNGMSGGRRSGLLNSNSLKGRRAQRERVEREQREKAKAEEEARDAERAEIAAREKAERDAEREEYRKQLLSIQEDLRRDREELERVRNREAMPSNEENDAQ